MYGWPVATMPTADHHRPTSRRHRRVKNQHCEIRLLRIMILHVESWVLCVADVAAVEWGTSPKRSYHIPVAAANLKLKFRCDYRGLDAAMAFMFLKPFYISLSPPTLAPEIIAPHQSQSRFYTIYFFVRVVIVTQRIYIQFFDISVRAHVPKITIYLCVARVEPIEKFKWQSVDAGKSIRIQYQHNTKFIWYLASAPNAERKKNVKCVDRRWWIYVGRGP